MLTKIIRITVNFLSFISLFTNLILFLMLIQNLQIFTYFPYYFIQFHLLVFMVFGNGDIAKKTMVK